MKKRLPVIPPMKCDDNCGDCCGIVPATEAEYATVAAYVAEHNITPVDQGITCPFYQGGRCAVHEARPLLCKLFGHASGMTCSRGYNVNMREKDVRKMLFDTHDNENAPRYLHEFLPEFGAKAARRRAAFFIEKP